VAALAVIAIGVPVAIAFQGNGSALDRQLIIFYAKPVTTGSTNWRNVPQFTRLPVCVRDGTDFSATITVNARGAPVAFRIYDSGGVLWPRKAQFAPSVEAPTFSFTVVGILGTIEVGDQHRLNLQWKSATGDPVTLKSAAVRFLWTRQGADC
jgi:hypothetical protein